MKKISLFLLFNLSFFSIAEVLPSKFENNLIYLTPQLPDGTTINFFTDTGAGWNAISKDIVDKYQWSVEDRQAETGIVQVTDMPMFKKDASIPLAGLKTGMRGNCTWFKMNSLVRRKTLMEP